jgi:hypothetical protein
LNDLDFIGVRKRLHPPVWQAAFFSTTTRSVMTMGKLSDLQAMVQEAIDKGATNVEEVHKSIANMPMDLLAKIGPLENVVNQGKTLQEQTIGAVYENIRLVNEKVGEMAAKLLGGK